MNSLEEKYGGDVHVHENTWLGLFGIITAMRALIAVMYALTETFILIVTIMTSGRVISAEQKDLGIYKAVEFNSIYLRVSFAARFGIRACLVSRHAHLTCIFSATLRQFFLKYIQYSCEKLPSFGEKSAA